MAICHKMIIRNKLRLWTHVWNSNMKLLYGEKRVCRSSMKVNTAICGSHMLWEFLWCSFEAKRKFASSPTLRRKFGAALDWLPQKSQPSPDWRSSCFRVVIQQRVPSFHTSVAECLSDGLVPDRAPGGRESDEVDADFSTVNYENEAVSCLLSGFHTWTRVWLCSESGETFRRVLKDCGYWRKV